ncbi:MAG: hypothetical protein L7F78_07395 [Syntrophales bacterium LBB04]|nr:hypothetical protein [Syntrophales bacterium LBB04]
MYLRERGACLGPPFPLRSYVDPCDLLLLGKCPAIGVSDPALVHDQLVDSTLDRFVTTIDMPARKENII